MHFIFLKSGLNIHWILHFESWFVLFLSLTLNSAIEMSFPPQSLNLIGCCEHRKFSTFSAFDENLLWLATAISHYYLLNFCSKLWLAAAISHYYLLNFRSKLWLATAKKLMSEIEWVKGILQTKIYNGEIHEYLKHPYSHSNATLEKFISITK